MFKTESVLFCQSRSKYSEEHFFEFEIVVFCFRLNGNNEFVTDGNYTLWETVRNIVDDTVDGVGKLLGGK